MRRKLSPHCQSASKRSKMNKSDGNITETIKPSIDPIEEISVRGYQTELMEQAKRENLIICLPTGSGKTYIAVMLIKEMSHSTRESLKHGGKRTIFLVKTVQLAAQQSKYISHHTDLSVGVYYGELGVDFWEKPKWDIEFERHQILVFTAQVFLNIVDHNIFSLNNVNLIIFDECHHATGENQYAALMTKHYDKCTSPPRVLGLTASISSKKIRPKNLADDARELEKIYRARIESGSNRIESYEHGTCAQVETISYASYQKEILTKNESLTIPFHFINIMINLIKNYLSKQKDIQEKMETDLSQTMLTTDYRGENLATYHRQSSDHTTFIQSQPLTLIGFRRLLENVLEVGYELGLTGSFFFAKEIRKRLKANQVLLPMLNSSAHELFKDIFQRFECLVDDILKPLCLSHQTYDILFSPKVIQLIERIIHQQKLKGPRSKCIVFVERVHTANTLTQVLTNLIESLESPWDQRLKVKHVTGIKAGFGDKPMTTKNQQQILQEFRSHELNILIATAVIEEGLDIPECDLVIRFNKPNNFSSYMQSKGRARSKENASYVLFIDEPDVEAHYRDRTEYDNYEAIEKMIQHGFSLDDTQGNSECDLEKIPPYCTSKGVVIDATRAAQLIMEYCMLLGNGQIFPPRFLFHGYSSPFTCILSMPANCPVRDDVVCRGEQKKLAKYRCCLEMVKKLHQSGEFDDYCLPNRQRAALKIETPIHIRLFRLCDELFEQKSDSSFEYFTKQIATFPMKSDLSSTTYLYRIDEQLGVIIPCSSIELPAFQIYGNNEIIRMKCLKSIDCTKYRRELEEFCRYIFENVFQNMNTDTILRFDMENSSFKLFPCLLTTFGEIDWTRMKKISQRKNRFLQTHSELTENELYCPIDLFGKQLYTYVPDQSHRKRLTDRWTHLKHSVTIQTYADHFQEKHPRISLERNAYLIALRGWRRPKINYLKMTTKPDKNKSNDSNHEFVYHPFEHLQYAPLNQEDYQTLARLPSILVRISQLYRIEKLRKSLAENVGVHSFIEADQMSIVTFQDSLKSCPSHSLLPLIPLTYDNLINRDSNARLSSNILFQAVTRRSTDENFDMENLEILGDCFLKLTVSLSLYHRYPLAGAGALTIEKAKQISNGNLYRIVLEKKLKNSLYELKIDFQGEHANWIPPGYCLVDSSTHSNRYKSQKAKRKAFADMIEGLIGAYLISTNYSTTLTYMDWLGLDVIPEEKRIPSIVCSSIENGVIDGVLKHFYDEQKFSFVEEIIHYKFKNKAYLIAAFTHPSSFANRLTNCYERLEFLGDAVLDFLVTRYIFVNHKDITPGRVTDIRQDLSNNGRLAYIFVACGLHTKILHNSPDLFSKITAYTCDEELFPKDATMNSNLNKDIDQWANSTAPKALADVFEALVGAIFLDADKCLATVWKVLEPLLQNYLDRSIIDPNLNPVRSFFERGGKLIHQGIGSDCETEKPISICMIEAPNQYYFKGFGDNRKSAKADACRKALKFLETPSTIS